jgi:hypothetical protein
MSADGQETNPVISTMTWQLPLWKAWIVTWPAALSPTANEFGMVCPVT